MTKSTQPPLIDKLKIFYEELIEYKKLEGNRLALTGEEHGRRKFLREQLLREAQIFKDKIIELTNFHHIKIKEKTYDIWVEAFDHNFFSAARGPSIDHCIDSTNIAIGKLESLELSETGGYSNLSTPQEIASYLFDAMQFHPKVVEASKSCFTTINYREAILNAFISLIDYIKEISGLDLDGDDLMNNVFSFNYDKEQRKITKYPIICINELKNRTDRDEQQGFMFLCKGAAAFVRNPKAHKLILQSNPLHTLEYLAFASLLIKKVEEGKVKKTRPPRQRWNLERFLADAQERCIPERIDIMKKLIDFTVSNSDAGILWGTGAKYGSFVFQKLIQNIPVSIFQVYTDGTFFLFFSPMKNKGVNTEILNQFRSNLNKISGVTISEKVITEKNKYGSLGLNILYRDNNLKLFQDAVVTLCNQIDSEGV